LKSTKPQKKKGELRLPFFCSLFLTPGPGSHPKLEKTSKLANPTLLVWEAEGARAWRKNKREKTSKLLIFIQRLKACLFMGNVLY
jgi:hypothetical protein